MSALALALTLTLSAGGKGNADWVKNYVTGDDTPAGDDTQTLEEQDARAKTLWLFHNASEEGLSKLASWLNEVLADSTRDESVRARSAQVMGWLRQRANVPVLAEALKGENPLEVREEAASALRYFGTQGVKYNFFNDTGVLVSRHIPGVSDPRATAALIEATHGPNERVRRAALRALVVHSGPLVATAGLDAAREHRDGPEALPLLLRAQPADLEKLLLAYAKSDDAVDRAAGARGLGQAHLVSSRARLLELLDDPSAIVFAAAHGALRELDGLPPADMPADTALDRKVLTARWKAKFQ
jgi:hypothetical protein